MHLKCYRLVATTTATTTTSTMMRITLMGRRMMKPIHSLMFNQLTHGNNNKHRHGRRQRHKLINNNRNYISALRRRLKHTFRVLWVCRSLGQSVSQSSLPVATHTYFLCNRSLGSVAGSAGAAAGVAALKACQIFVTHFCIHFPRGSPRQADRHSSFYTQSINYCYFP